MESLLSTAIWKIANIKRKVRHMIRKCLIVTVELTKTELLIINNTLNEVCNGIDLEGEFDTRMGCSVQEARAVLAKIHALASD